MQKLICYVVVVVKQGESVVNISKPNRWRNVIAEYPFLPKMAHEDVNRTLWGANCHIINLVVILAIKYEITLFCGILEKKLLRLIRAVLAHQEERE